jgi:hypothetical protein
MISSVASNCKRIALSSGHLRVMTRPAPRRTRTMRIRRPRDRPSSLVLAQWAHPQILATPTLYST